MKIFVFISLIALGLASSSHLPAISWSQDSRSNDEIPLLRFEFPDGSVDYADLSRFNPIPVAEDEDPSTVDDCIFHGYLKNEANVYVTVTGGCPDSDSFDVMLRSSKLQGHAYTVKQGVIEQVESVFAKHSSRNGMNNRDEVPQLPELDTFLNRQVSSRVPFPANGFTMRVKTFYDQRFKSRFGTGSLNTIRRVMALVQNFYYWSSLTTRITLNMISGPEIPLSLSVTESNLYSVQSYITDSSINSNVFFTNHNNAGGVVGLAWPGVACHPSFRFRANLDDYFVSDLKTAEIVAHEIGHNLGMSHDFNGQEDNPRYDSRGRTCTNIGGILDYNQPVVNKWSTCSVEDFQRYFDRNQPFCLASGTSNPVTTTRAPVTTTNSFISFCRRIGSGCFGPCAGVRYSSSYVCTFTYGSYNYRCNCSYYA